MKHTPVSASRRGERRGAGVVFLLAIGILVVLFILLFTQSRTQDQTGREISASALGSRARVAAESCLTEASYWVTLLAEESEEDSPAYQALRAHVPGSEGEPSEPGLLDPDQPLFLETFEWFPEATRAAYQGEEDVRFDRTRVGILSRQGFEGEEDLATRDHRGVLAVQQEVVVTPPWGGFSIKVVSHAERAYRSVTLGVPAPFSRFTVMVQEKSDDDNHLRRYYEAWRQVRQDFLGGGGDEADFPPFPVSGMEGSVGGFFATTAAAVPPEAWNLDAMLSVPGDLAASPLPEFRDAMAVLATGGWQRLSEGPLEPFLENMPLLDARGLGARTCFQVQNMADLAGFFGDEGALVLDGVVQVRDAITLEHRVEGPAVLWTDSPKGILVRGLETTPELAARGGLVLVATQGDIRVEVPPGTVLPASLVALRGSVRGLDGVRIHGHLLSGAFPPGLSTGVGLQRPAQVVPEPAPGAAFDELGRRLTRVLFDSGWTRRETNQRRLRGS